MMPSFNDIVISAEEQINHLWIGIISVNHRFKSLIWKLINESYESVSKMKIRVKYYLSKAAALFKL